jgi:hypothetical protein
MARVLVPGGRLALSVWRPLERQPFFVALVDAIESHLGAEVGGLQRAAFTLGGSSPTAVKIEGFPNIMI